ncbi:hypothetical protein BDV59DRAFT_16966 [Aspergillus ambiguus]|uniref:uncharacterized protein n=1 Tax=Aspergillus ambiguus TaxID=176160 RepID=UPI003CCDB2C4
MSVTDGSAYFVVNHKYHRSLGVDVSGSFGTGNYLQLQKQGWDTNNLLEPILVEVVRDRGGGKKEVHMKVFSMDTVLTATSSSPKHFEAIADPANPANAALLPTLTPLIPYTTWDIKPIPYDHGVGNDVLLARIKNSKTGNYIQATSSNGAVVCRSKDKSDDDVIWKLVRLPDRHELEKLWSDRVDADLLEGDKEVMTQEVRQANRMLRDMREFIRDLSGQLTENFRYLQAGQYQTFWPYYQNMEAHARNFVQRGFR